MRKNEKGEIILTRKKAAEMFCLLSNARLRLSGKLRTDAEKYWREFEKVFELNTKEEKNEEKVPT